MAVAGGVPMWLGKCYKMKSSRQPMAAEEEERVFSRDYLHQRLSDPKWSVLHTYPYMTVNGFSQFPVCACVSQ